MLKIFIPGTCARAVNLLTSLIMSKTNEKVYYAVGRGREVGIFYSWKDCKAQIDGISNAKFRKFSSIEEAEEFVSFWKNYSSPGKMSVDSEKAVSSHAKGGGRKSVRIARGFLASSPKASGVVLGRKGEEERNGGGEDTFFMTPYDSPISGLLGSNDYSSRHWFRNGNSERRRGKAEEGRGQVECGRSEPRFTVGEISTPKTDFQFSVPGSVTADQVPRSVFPKSDSDCASVKEVKKEVVEVENESEDCDEIKSDPNVCGMLATCLTTLETALKIISKQNDQESARVRNGLKAVALRILGDTNGGVNPQMDGGDENADEHQGNGGSEPPVAESSPPPQHRQHPPHQSPCACSEPSSATILSSSFDGKVDQKNVDILALNLRLDSFEKRFDACLKEVGAIVSEVSHIKSELKELKESMASGSDYSPNRTREGLRQTTLSFGASGTSSSRCYSSARNDGNSEEPEIKRGRGLKRKLSTGNSLDGGASEILNKIKVETIDYTSFVVDSDEYVEVYTDGACHCNGKKDAKAGIGIWFGNSHPLNVAAPVDGSPTNNSAEIQAARVAIELAMKAGVSKLKIFTDSEFLINCATKWMHRWKKNGWTLVNGGQVKNRKELEKLDKVASKISIRWEKVEAHSGIHGNEMADRLANEGAAKYGR